MLIVTDGSRRVSQCWLPSLLNSVKSSRAEHESNRYNHRASAARVDIRAWILTENNKWMEMFALF